MNSATPLYLDARQPPLVRAEDLVERMTLEEKASQMVNHSRAIPRLGVPDYNYWSESLHGLMSITGPATVYPEPIGLAATFDPDLVHQMAEAIALEGRERYASARREGRTRVFEGLTFFAPNLNIFRDPRWGRGQETYGEDPWLTSRMGVAYITGLQGDDRNHPRAVATAKHFAVHSGPEPLRHEFDAKVSSHDLEDTYLPAFRAAVIEGRVASVMCVYNAIDGVPGCANSSLLHDTLRQDWAFDGFVVSDCDAINNINETHHFAKTSAESRAIAVHAGMDNECRTEVSDFFPAMPRPSEPEFQVYVEAFHEGLLTESDLDTALKRSLRWRFALGMFDEQSTGPRVSADSLPGDNAAHRALALEAARQSMVLLKNNGVLPLGNDVRRIAVVGPLADQSTVLMGNYSGRPSRSSTVLDGLRRVFPAASVTFERGADVPGDPPQMSSKWLSTDEGKPGLKAEHFSGMQATGKPILTRIEPNINGQGISGSARPAGVMMHAVRWTGWLTPDQGGEWQLGLRGLLGTLSLDGNRIVDMSQLGPPSVKTAMVTLEAGHRYPLAVESTSSYGSIELVATQLASAESKVQRAVASAATADVIVAVVGISSQLEGEESSLDIPGFKGGDRTSLELPQAEQSLLEALRASGKPLVVVVMNGSPLAISWAQQNADAILEAWYPGEEGGLAVAETLSGKNNPAGRLPVTFYKSLEQLPPFEDYSMANRTYRYYTGEVLYPFGYGLSYANFAYADLKLTASTIKAGQSIKATALITNKGTRDGDEVAQLYVVFPELPGAPRHALRAFKRLRVRAGETQQVVLSVGARELSYVDPEGRHRIAPGHYSISVGGGQPGTGPMSVSTSLTITGEQILHR